MKLRIKDSKTRIRKVWRRFSLVNIGKNKWLFMF